MIDAMHAWKHESEFASLMEEKEIFTRSPPTPLIADAERDRYAANHALTSLQPMVQYLSGKEEELKKLGELINFVQQLCNRVPVDNAEEQFEILHPLRTWLFFLPIDFLRRGGVRRQDPRTMVLLAHYYGVALAVEPLFPAVGAAYFGTMSVGPIEKIHTTLAGMASQRPEAQRALDMMGFPLQMVSRFRERMDWKRRLSSAGAVVAAAPRTSIHSSHLAGWDFQAFPEYAMLAGAGPLEGVPGAVRAPVMNVQESSIATDFIASAMNSKWREGGS